MPSFKTALVAALAATVSAFPAPSQRDMKIYSLAKRQNALAAAAGLTDIDILQFALTLENLESAFYQQGFAKFPASDFLALGLTQQEVTDLLQVGKTEQEHVSVIQSAIAQAGTQPVQACTYNFGFTTAQAMVQTAAVLENIGVSAYLGAAPLVSSGGILSVAGSILTIEARHQTFIRAATKGNAVPQAFDAALGPKAVFTMAAPFVQSCPQGSNLILTPNPPLTMTSPAASSAIAIGSTLQLTASNSSSTPTHCGFTSGGVLPGGTAFSPFTQGSGCVVPQNLAGVTYLTLTNAAPADGVLTDAITVAGPMPIAIS